MDKTTNPTGHQLPAERPEEVAARQIAAVVPQPLQDRMEALRHRAAALLQYVGPQILDLIVEKDAVEAAVNETFGSTPGDWETRFAGTGVDYAGGVLGMIDDLASEHGDPEDWPAQIASVVADAAEVQS